MGQLEEHPREVVIEIIKINSAHLGFVNSDNLSIVKNMVYLEAVMELNIPNLSSDFVKDMLAESPAKELKAVVADRIRNLLILCVGI